MSTAAPRAMVIAVAVGLSACLPDGQDRCGDGFVWEDDNCYAIDTDSSTGEDIDTDTVIEAEKWIGSSCSCSGEECENTGVPVPHAGEISGCGDVPTDWPGALKACLRSYVGSLSFDTDEMDSEDDREAGSPASVHDRGKEERGTESDPRRQVLTDGNGPR